MDINSYLTRIEYDGALELTPEVLSAIHYAHLLRVPFENLDVHLGQEIILDERRFFHKIVTEQRGGFCYELNGAFAGLLKGLGFEVDSLSARVYKSGGFGPEFAHLVLRVRLEEDWLVDVGFGDSFLKPLLMRDGQVQTQRGVAYRLVEGPSGWELQARNSQGRWESSYRFSLHPRQLADFKDMCRYQQTSPESHFTQKRLCTRVTPEGRITISGNCLIVTENGQRNETELAGEGEYLTTLKDHFGIRLPKP